MDPAFEWLELPSLHDPVALVAFEGWNDAGDAASGAVAYLRDFTDAHMVAVIDHDDFNDHQVTRPYAAIDEAGERTIDWPDTRLYVSTVAGRDVMLVLGEEPRLKWKRFCRMIAAALKEVETKSVVTFGAFLGQVPHTLDVPIIGSYDIKTRQQHDLLPSRYVGPTGIVGVLNHWLRREGFSAGSLWAAVPHYLQSSTNPKAARALLEKAQSVIGIDLDLSELDIEVAEWEARVAAAVADNEELAGYLLEMEEVISDVTADGNDTNLVEEIERFLRNQ